MIFKYRLFYTSILFYFFLLYPQRSNKNSNKMSNGTTIDYSYIRVVLLEGVSPFARKELEDQGYNVEYIKHALQGDELIEKIKDAHIIGVRSRTQITEQVINSCNNLFIIGCFCIGITISLLLKW